MITKELRIVPALEGQESSDDQPSAKVLSLGNPGISWTKVQELMRETRGLPVRGPPGIAQTVLRQQARRNGFNLLIRVPPALHHKSTCSEDWDVTEEPEWMHFLSVIPFNEAEALGAVKELSRWQLGGWAYTAAMAGWHMLWEVAVSSLTRGLGGIWGAAEVEILVDAMAASLQVVDDPGERVGKATAGACAAAALWWLLCQPRFPLHAPAQNASGGSSTQAHKDVHEAIAAASEIHWRSWDPGQEMPQSSGGGRLKQTVTLLEEGVHPKDLHVVRATPLPHHMLHCLLQSGLLRLSTAKLRELSLALLGKKGKAEVLKASYRRNHTAKAAAWSAGALFQALSIPFVQGALVSACVEELLLERVTAKRQQQQQQLQQQVEAPGAMQEKMPTVFGQSKFQGVKNGTSQATTPRATQRQYSDRSTRSQHSHQSAGEGKEDGSGRAPRSGPEFSSAFLLLGVNAPGAVWSSLTAAAVLPKWLRAPDHCHIAPPSWIEALITIQLKYKARASRRQWVQLREQLRQAGYNARGARAMKKALLPESVLSKEDMEAGRIANEKLAALNAIPIEDISQYFNTRADNHAGVCAAEALLSLLLVNTFSMAVENDSGVAESVNPLRAHFLMAADTKMLIQMLGKSLPLRSQHIGVCILSLYFYSPLPDGAPKLSQSQPRVRNLDVHALVPCLEHLVALEKIELLSRYGMGMLNAAAAEADYAHSIKPSKAGGGAAGAASAAAGMSPQMLGGSATRHHHLLRRATTANLGKGANHRSLPLTSSSHDHRRATVATASNAELFGVPEHQPASNSSTAIRGSNSSAIPFASTVPGYHVAADAAARVGATAGEPQVQGQLVWPSDGTPIVLSKSTQDGKPVTCADGSLVGGPPGFHNAPPARGTAASGAGAGATTSSAAGVQDGARAAPQDSHMPGSSGQEKRIVMGHHVGVPLRNLRWKSHGSEVSVHAAVCCWGCARIVAEQECAKEQQHHQRLAAFKGTVMSNHVANANLANPAQSLQHCMAHQTGAEQKGKDLGGPNALGAAVKARANSAALDQQEQTTLLLMQMLARCLKCPCHGPAAHLLSAAMVLMAHEPAAVPMLLKLGLIDAGDQKGLVSASALNPGKPKQGGRGVLSQARWGMELCDAPPRNGLMGIMSSAHHSTHARCLIALIACVALADPGPPSGQPPNPAWVFKSSPSPGKESKPSEDGRGPQRACSIKGNDSEDEEGDRMLTKEGVNGRLRLLQAGAWPLLQTCRDTCGPPQTSEVQQALAIAYMYLGQEIEQCYTKVLEAARQERRAQRVSVPATAEAPEATAVAEMDDLAPSIPHSVEGVSEKEASHQSSQPDTLSGNESDDTLSDTDSVLEHQGHLDMQPLYRLLLAGKYSTLEEAVKPLCELLACSNSHVASDDASTSLAGIHTFASLAANSLAAVPGLKEPMGEAGAIQALVNIVRRWVDSSLSDQRSQKRTAESALAALTRLMQGPEGAKNILRFAASWKTGSKEAVARELLKEFGYPMTTSFDAPPSKTYRTTADLIGGTSWSAWGRGSKHAAAHARALEQQQPLGASGHWHQNDSVSSAVEVDQMASCASFQVPGSICNQDITSTSLTRQAGPQGGKLQQEGENTQRSSFASKKEDNLAALLSDSRSALDPIQVMVQVVAIRTRQKSRYMQIKLHALLALKIVAQVGDIRQRLIESGAGPQLSDLAGDAGFDSRTRAAAGSLWLEISHTKEGQWPLWWSCMMQDPGANPPLSTSELHEKYGEQFTCVTAQMRMCFLMLQSREPETELVGANHSASLLCQGDTAKQRFYEAGGLGALINVASCSTTTLTVLAPVCTALLNLSSFIPIQVEMCNKVLRLMLHINSKYGRLNGYKPTEENISERESLNSSMSGSHVPSVVSSMKSRRMREVDNSMTQAVLYCSSGCLWNLSRNPDNRDLFYRAELEIKARQAMVDVLEEGALPATPQKGALRFSQPPLTAKGMPVDAHTAALLQELLSEPLVEEEEHHARLDGRDVGFDMGGQGKPLSRSPSGQESVAAEPTLQRRASFSGFSPADLGANLTRPSSLSQYRGSRAASHRGLGSDISSSTASGSYAGEWAGGGKVPRLATLQRRLQAPRASMFAPLSVDKHNTAAAALFALRGEQPPELIANAPAAGAGTDAIVGNKFSRAANGFGDPYGLHSTSASLAGSQHMGHTELAAGAVDGSTQEHGIAGPGEAQQQQRQQEQQALWHRAQRQRQQRHRLHHGALSGSTVLRPHTAPNSGPSSRWSAHIESCTLHPPSPLPLSPSDRAVISPKPAFAKARAAAAAEAAAAEAAAVAAAMPDNEWGLKGGLQLSTGSNTAPAPAFGAIDRQQNSGLQGPSQPRHPLNTQSAMQGQDSSGNALDVCLSFLPGSQHVRVRGLRSASDAHNPNRSHGGAQAGTHAQRFGRSGANATNASVGGAHNLRPSGETPEATSMLSVTTHPATTRTLTARLHTHTYAANSRVAAPANGAAGAATAMGAGLSAAAAAHGTGAQNGCNSAVTQPHGTADYRAQGVANGGGGHSGAGGGAMSMVEAYQGVLQQVEATFAAPHKPLVKSQHMDCGPLASKAHNRAAQQLETDTPESAPPNISKLALGVTRSAGVQKGLQQSEQQQSQIRQAQLQDRHTDAGIGRPSQKPSVFSKTWRDMPEWKLDSKQRALRDFEVPGATVWPAVEGSALGQRLFTKFTPENGAAHPGGNVQGLYIYRSRKTRVDEIPPPQDPHARRGFDFGCSISLEGVDELARELLRPWTELPFQPVMPNLEVPRPPMFERSLLPDLKSLSTLDAVVSPKPSPTGAEGQEAGSGWRLEDSVFAHRPRQCESKDFYDNQRITEMAMEQDLSRCMGKKRFQKFLDKWAPKEARDELVAELKRRHADLLRIFDWYACLGSGDPFSMQIGAWGQLMTDTNIADDRSKGCKLSDLDRVFLATNLEEGKSEADKINLDNSLMRFEFLEGILRVTVVKAFESKPLKQKGKSASGAKDDSRKQAEQKGDPGAAGESVDPKSLPKPATLAEAVSRVFDYHLLPGVPPESLLDNNAWRKERLYTEDVDLLLKANLPVLQSVFNHYAALLTGHDMKLMDLPEWMEILTEADLFKSCRDFNVRDGKLAFIWSRMRCVDDTKSLKALQRSRALTFEEFLDALCHVADMISPPPVPELLAIGCSEHHPTTNYFMKVCNEGSPLRRRDSVAIRAPKTRPLDEKLEQVLELLLDNLMVRHGARNHAHLMERLKASRGRGYNLGKGS